MKLCKITSRRMFVALILGCLPMASVHADSVNPIPSIVYDSGLNQWTITGFENTFSGQYVNSGIGLGGLGPYTRTGADVSQVWDVIGGGNGGGGLHFWNGISGDFTDFWHPLSTTWTVSGAKWTNNTGDNNFGDGFYRINGDGGDNPTVLGTPIAENTLLNGTFSYTAAPTNGLPILQYTPIPEPATMTLLALGGLTLLRRRKRGRG